MTVRSPALAVLGILLMASAGALGAVLVHDGEVPAKADLATADPGQQLRLKGTPEPFSLDGPSRAWRSIVPVLENHTYTLEDPDGGIVALLTSARPAPEGVVLADGTVRHVAPHPDGSGRLLVVVAVQDWTQPILFR